jgi:hypothetical protein
MKSCPAITKWLVRPCSPSYQLESSSLAAASTLPLPVKILVFCTDCGGFASASHSSPTGDCDSSVLNVDVTVLQMQLGQLCPVTATRVAFSSMAALGEPKILDVTLQVPTAALQDLPCIFTCHVSCCNDVRKIVELALWPHYP